MFQLFQNENTAQGVTSSNFQAGVNNLDQNQVAESGLLLPYVIDPRVSWLEYSCRIEYELDPGIVLHKILPQTAQPIDTLASGTFDGTSGKQVITGLIPVVATQGGVTKGITNVAVTGFAKQQPIDTSTVGANGVSAGKFTDFVQRMATSRYRFALKGHALRFGYKIPIPGLVTVCGVPAIPDWPQRVISDSEVTGNFSGVPLFFAQWELWYFINVPPKSTQLPPPNIAEHIRADAELPSGMQVPYSQPDSNSKQSGSPPSQRVIIPG
jgi:hypothetical protein